MGFRTKIRSSSPRLLNSWLFFITLCILIFVFIMYFFVYVKGNERRQIARRFRVLAQVGQNIKERERGFRKIAEHAEERLETNEKRPAALKDLLKNLPDTKNASRKEIDKFQKRLTVLIKEEIEKANEDLQIRTAENKGEAEGPLVFAHIKIDDKEIIPGYVVHAKAVDFFTPLHRPDVFDNLVVLEEKGKELTVLYHTFPGDIDTPGPQKIKSITGGIESGILKEIDVSNIKYKMFFQPLQLGKDKKWYLGATVKVSTFKKEISDLKSGVIIPLLILFTIFILAIPLLKLFLMSTFEQLNTWDVISTTLTITLGTMALLFLVLFLYLDNQDRRRVDENLAGLSRDIRESFTGELKEGYDQLHEYDRRLGRSGLKKGDNVIDVLTGPKAADNMKMSDNAGNKRNDINFGLLVPGTYKLFKGTYWMDKKGEQIIQLSTRNYGGSLVDLSHRDYFKNAGTWLLPARGISSFDRLVGKVTGTLPGEPGRPQSIPDPFNPFPGHRFRLESITSVTSGEKLAAISMKSSHVQNNREERDSLDGIDAEVIAMSVALTSVIDTIMPAGYGFCIIDRSGEVWFHSDTLRNHQENFIAEIDNHRKFTSTLKSRQTRHLTLDYQNLKHRCHISPVPMMPLSLVVFQDCRYTGSTQGCIMLYSLFFIALLSFFNCLFFLLTGWCHCRKSMLKKKRMPFEWFRPLARNAPVYRHLVIANLVLTALLILFRTWAGHSETWFLCISAAIFSFAYNYSTLSSHREEPGRPRQKAILPITAALLALSLLAASEVVDRLLPIILFQITLAFACVLITLAKTVKLSRPTTWRQSYVGFLLSWLILVGVVPVLMFYLDAYNYEHETALRHLHQARLAEAIETRNFTVDSFYNKKISNPGGKNYRLTRELRKKRGIYSTHHEASIYDEEGAGFNQASPIPDSIFNRITFPLVPPMNKLSLERRAFVFPRTQDSSRTWRKGDGQLFLRYRVSNSFPSEKSKNRAAGEKDYIYIASKSQTFTFTPGFSLVILMLSVLGILLLAYHLIRYAIEMIFGLNLALLYHKDRRIPGIRQEINGYLQAGASLLIYCPPQKCEEYTDSLFSDGNVEKKTPGKSGTPAAAGVEPPGVTPLDLIGDKDGIEELIQGPEKILLIRNFKLTEEDIAGNREKLESLVTLLRTGKFQLVLPTSLPLGDIIDYYNEKAAQAEGKGDKPGSRNQDAHFSRVSELLNEINQELLPLYLPLKVPSQKMKEEEGEEAEPCSPAQEIEDHKIRQFILRELSCSDYFAAIEAPLCRYYDTIKARKGVVTEEEITLKIQELAGHYYQALLNSCTGKEKYILYDFAQDMLVNPNDRETIEILIKKGFLKHNGTFRMMSESFRNFILTSLDLKELKGSVRALSPRWSGYKAPFSMIILGLVVFFAFQGNILDEFNALITAVIGGLAIVTKFSGVLTKFTIFGGNK